eukprot:CAMPEP_0195523922 /NCGR_PEP_ID=MMETSP0794_2-20130614/23439_1 /TAXON_ID=515487 /ORGANISM="Stephanopyxis turris, Strain CCMP 815" /LENGTH=139 /DNA_ID=CAMNT_0040654027 /DNA_START=48 /DNA_END=464 /DNA_ORIENTATION=+
MSAMRQNRLLGPKSQPQRPNKNTYWVKQNLMAGEYPGHSEGQDETRQKLRRYLDCGVTFFLDLTEEHETQGYDRILQEEALARGMKDSEVEYRRVPIPDFGIPNEKKRMTSILDAIDDAANRNHIVYVHCRGGIGRTGT